MIRCHPKQRFFFFCMQVKVKKMQTKHKLGGIHSCSYSRRQRRERFSPYMTVCLLTSRLSKPWSLQWKITAGCFFPSLFLLLLNDCFQADLFSRSHSCCPPPLPPDRLLNHRNSSALSSFLPGSWSNLRPSLPSPSFSFSLDHHSIHLSFIPVSCGSPVGAERWRACVCLALLSAFLMSLKHRGVSLLWRWGDRGRPKGDKPH